MSSSQRCELRSAIRPGGDQIARLTPAVYFDPSRLRAPSLLRVGGTSVGLVLLEQLAPAICVEVLAAAVRADEGADPGSGAPILLDALQAVHALATRQDAAVQMSTDVRTRGPMHTR